MIYTLTHQNRARIAATLSETPDGYQVSITEPKRSLAQNAAFHDLCGMIAKSGFKWMGKPRTAAEWKVLLVSGHAIATGHGAEVIAGLEGELVNIREPTSKMSIKRGSSLIEYTEAFCAMQGIKLPYRCDD
jgi:hypothetical protein